MTATEQFQNLPIELATRHADLFKAMVQPDDPTGEWDDAEPYLKALAPKAIAKILIGVFHPMLSGRQIAYLWRESMERNGKVALGKASVASGKVKFFGNVDFVIEFNYTAWQHLSPRERVALVDHELTHCAVDAESMKSIMVAHDIEEFGSIVKKWGLWMPDLERFGEVVIEARQLGLFEPAGA